MNIRLVVLHHPEEEAVLAQDHHRSTDEITDQEADQEVDEVNWPKKGSFKKDSVLKDFVNKRLMCQIHKRGNFEKDFL